MTSYDTGKRTITIGPISGDNWPNLQSAVNYALQNAYTVKLINGSYPISKPLMIAKWGSDYSQVSIQFEGPVSCKASPDNMQAILVPQFNDKPAIIVQRGKGVKIKNIACHGPFKFTNSLTELQIQTLTDWSEGPTGARDNRWSPQCFVAIDPFCDPDFGADSYPGLEANYLKGMSRAGSTGVQIVGCRGINNVVGIIFQPSYQQNGDCCDVIDCCLEYNKTDIAYTQTQSKANTIIRLKDWGHTRTVIDGVSYGRGMGVLPYCDGANIAGGVHQLFDMTNADFQGSVKNWYAESIFKIGKVNGYQTTLIESLTCDFMTQGPVPDFLISGNVNFKDAHLRYYDNTQRRLNLSGFNGTFQDGDFDTYPIISCPNNGGSGWPIPSFDHVGLAQLPGPPDKRPFLSNNNYGKITYLGGFQVTVTDYISTYVGPGNVGDYIITGDLPGMPMAQVGRIKSIDNGTVTLDQVCVKLISGKYNLYKDEA